LATDSSNFVEHLRLVHVTLIIACVVMLAAMTSQTPSSSSRAYEQTNQLIRLRDRWDNGNWLKNFITQKRPNIQFVRYVTADGRKFMFVQPMDPLFEDWFVLSKGSASDTKAFTETDLSRRSRTLADIEKIWNTLHDYRTGAKVTEFLNGWLIDRAGQSPPQAMSLTTDADRPPEVLTGPGAHTLRLYLPNELLSDIREHLPQLLETLSKLIRLDSGDCYLSMVVSSTDSALVRARCSIENLDLQSLLSDGLPGPSPPPGGFSQSFPDVDDLAKNLTALTLEDLRSHFLSEKNRAGEKVEFSGIKLPGEIISYWGIVIIICISAYFIGTLRDFASRVTPGDKCWDIAWIGTSGEISSVVVFVGTVLLPPVAVGFLGWQIILDSEKPLILRMYAIGALIGATGASAVILQCWIRIQHIKAGRLAKPHPH